MAVAGGVKGPYNRRAVAKIVFMGTPEFAVPALQALVQAGHAVVGVYTQPDKPAGRGRKVDPSPVKGWALERGLAVFQPPSFASRAAVDELASLRPESIAVAAYGKILPQRVLDIPAKGTVNIHPSLLPKFRGPSPVATAILAGEKGTGVTIMLLDAGMDSGPILARRAETIGPLDTTESLERRLASLGAALLVETLPLWLEGMVTASPQDEDAATYSKLLRKADGEIDWDSPAEELARKVRAFQPWPGCYTSWHGNRVEILEGLEMQGLDHEAGTVVRVRHGAARGQEGDAIGVATGRGILLLMKVRPAGRRTMTAREFVAGRGDFVGAKLPS